MTPSPAVVRLLCGVLVVLALGVAPWSRGLADLRLSTTCAPGRPTARTVDWRPASWRLMADTRRSRTRFHVMGPRMGRIDSWVVGSVAVRWARGVSGLPAAQHPGGVLSGGATGGAGAGNLRGCGLLVRLGPGAVLLAGGDRQDDEAGAVLGWMHRRGGIMVTGKPVANRKLLEHPAASLALGFRGRGQSGEIEVAMDEGGPALASRVIAAAAGISTRIDVRLPGSRGVARETDGSIPRGAPTLDLELRSSPKGVRTLIGARAALPPTSLSATQNPTVSRSFLEIAVPLHRGEGSTEAVLRGDFRRDISTTNLLHAEIRTPLSRAACDWTTAGGLMVRFRSLWRLPAGFALDAGAAAWGGPIAGAGATANLPTLPEAVLLAPLARPGQALGLVIDWQVRPLRARLALSARQPHHGKAETRLASRIDLLLLGDEGEPAGPGNETPG